MPSGRLTGKVAVVTGGGSGIGLAIAKRFAEEGASVVIAGRDRDRLERGVAEIGHAARGVPTDVSRDGDVAALFAPLERVDILATCAGGAHFGAIDEVEPGTWRELFAGRFFGQMSACHQAVPKMPGGGVILLCSGVAGQAGLANYSGGSALCGAVNALGRALAVELGPRGIRVNVLSPGLIAGTAIKSNLAPNEQASFLSRTLERIPMHRPGRPGDIAEAAMFLVTCEYANGMVPEIDGGWTAG